MSKKHYLARHGRYVDYRIAILGGMPAHDQVERIPSHFIFSYLMDHSAPPEGLGSEERRALAELKDLLYRWDILGDGDLLGYVHQELQARETRKKHGRYFTPRDIVDYIVSRAIEAIPESSPGKILDPACGSGQFLIASYAYLLTRKTERKAVPESPEEILFCLHGMDSDPVAASICRWNLSRVSGVDESDVRNIYIKNYLFNKDGAVESVPGNDFNAVIGNPPWGSALSAVERRLARERFASARSGVNSFTLFIERTRTLLAPEGVMAFLLPEAYLNIKAHSDSRRQVLQHMRILDITSWGERFKGVFAPSVSLIAAREDSPVARQRNIVRIFSPVVKGKETATFIPQAHYLATPQNIFNIHYSRRAADLISRIEEKECRYLKGTARFFLGVVTGDNPRHLRDAHSEEAPDPIIIGRDLAQYRIDFSGHYFKYDPSTLQQVAPQELYLSRRKLLYRFIGRRLVFALDTQGRYSLNNVNGLIPIDPALEPEYLLALLNSRLMQYYYEKNFFTVKVLKGNLERLPLRAASAPTLRRLRSLAHTVMDEPNTSAGRQARETIEDLVFGMYGIGDAGAAHIIEAVGAQSAR